MKKKKQNKIRRNKAKLPFQGFSGTVNAKQYRKSKYYREELVPLIGKGAIIMGKVCDSKKSKIYGRWVNRILLREVRIIKTCKTYAGEGIVEHLWVISECGFLSRNHIKFGNEAIFSGSFYEYKKHDSNGNPLRNIGFKLDRAYTETEYKKKEGLCCEYKLHTGV